MSPDLPYHSHFAILIWTLKTIVDVKLFKKPGATPKKEMAILFDISRSEGAQPVRFQAVSKHFKLFDIIIYVRPLLLESHLKSFLISMLSKQRKFNSRRETKVKGINFNPSLHSENIREEFGISNKTGQLQRDHDYDGIKSEAEDGKIVESPSAERYSYKIFFIEKRSEHLSTGKKN